MTMPFKLSRAALAVSLAMLAGTAAAVPGYVTTGENGAITDSSGNCWRTGDWSPDKAAAPCDAVPRAAAPAAPLAETQLPETAPLAAAPPPTVIEKVTLSSDVLFEFNKADLRPEGQAKLDELARTAQGAQVDRVVIVGHADRIASDQYNQDLSERRAESVKRYLAAKGVPEQRVEAEGRGEKEPVTGNECARMGPERAGNRKLVQCLQPDRRVEVELLGQREVAGSGGTPSSGAGSPPSQ
jgi:OOP family OmpA-OmpF porin